MPLAEENFAGAQRSELRDRGELFPSALDESNRHAVARADDDHAVVVDDVLEIARIAIGAAIETCREVMRDRHPKT